jgi:hypothetical protein
MRSTTFDMIGMALMAVAVLITAGVGITWAYLRETRGAPRTKDKSPVLSAAASSDQKPPLGVYR